MLHALDDWRASHNRHLESVGLLSCSPGGGSEQHTEGVYPESTPGMLSERTVVKRGLAVTDLQPSPNCGPQSASTPEAVAKPSEDALDGLRLMVEHYEVAGAEIERQLMSREDADSELLLLLCPTQLAMDEMPTEDIATQCEVLAEQIDVAEAEVAATTEGQQPVLEQIAALANELRLMLQHVQDEELHSEQLDADLVEAQGQLHRAKERAETEQTESEQLQRSMEVEQCRQAEHKTLAREVDQLEAELQCAQDAVELIALRRRLARKSTSMGTILAWLTRAEFSLARAQPPQSSAVPHLKSAIHSQDGESPAERVIAIGTELQGLLQSLVSARKAAGVPLVQLHPQDGPETLWMWGARSCAVRALGRLLSQWQGASTRWAIWCWSNRMVRAQQASDDRRRLVRMQRQSRLLAARTMVGVLQRGGSREERSRCLAVWWDAFRRWPRKVS